MDKLFRVILEYDMIVIAEDEMDAISEAKYNKDSCDFPEEWVQPVESRKDIPYGWKDVEPIGVSDNEELWGTCNEIFNRIEERQAEEERKRKIKEEMDKKQLKFAFIDKTLKNGEGNGEDRF